MSVEPGEKAPDFTLPTDGAGSVTLSKLKGKKVVLYFYPKDDTSGCTAEACGFRDSLPDFSKVKAQVIGVSKDSVADVRASVPRMGSRSLRTVNKFPISIDDSETLGLFDKILSTCS